MSLTLDRLRALKRQAGASDVPAAPRAPETPVVTGQDTAPPAPAAVAPWAAVVDADAATRRLASPASAAADALPDIASCSSSSSPPTADGPTVTRAMPTPGAEALRRMLGLRERGPRPRPARALDRALPGEQIDDGLWLIESRVARTPPALPLPLAFARRDGHVDAQDLLFFDTETTGLAGGTGTRAFMIGAADWHEGALRIRQLLIANMAAEAAMLRVFASWLAPSTVLASYNGRSYDAPLLRTRYRLARLPDPLHGLDHLDLLHPSRRRWRGRWENCRLATIEREALRILREDDLPGAQAPAAWLSYLRGGDAVNLRRVAEHNRQDVATLAELLLCLSDEQTERS